MNKEKPKSLPIPASIIILCLLCGLILARAADDDAGQKTIIVQVVDQAGKPIAGALVMLAGEKPKYHSTWAEGMTELEADASQSDEQGNAPVTYYAKPYPNEVPPGLLLLLVQYPDAGFLLTEANLDVPQPIKLVSGTQVELSPQPISGVTFTKAIAYVQPDQWPANIKLEPSLDHSWITVNLPDGDYHVRLVTFTEEEKPYYSDLAKIKITAPIGGIGKKPVPVQEQLTMRKTLEETIGGTTPLPTKKGKMITEGAWDDLLEVANVAVIAWIWFALFCALIQHPSWLPWKNRLWIPTALVLVAYLAFFLALDAFTTIFLILDFFPGVIWVGLVGLLYLARKKRWGWLSWACAPPLGLMVLALALFGYATGMDLIADFKPSYAYRKEFGEFPSKDVRDIQSMRDNTFLGFTKVILKFHANRATFERIKPHDLTQISYGQFEAKYEHGEDYGGLLANYLRQDNLDPAGNQLIAAWCKKFDVAGEEIWYLPSNPSDTEILMTYEPSSESVEYYFFETE